MTTEQGNLFPSDEQPPVDVEAIAHHIAVHAKPVENKDRTSEAAIDQGHGPVPRPESTGDFKPRPLTSAQKNAINRKKVSEHLARVAKQVRDPRY